MEVEEGGEGTLGMLWNFAKTLKHELYFVSLIVGTFLTTLPLFYIENSHPLMTALHSEQNNISNHYIGDFSHIWTRLKVSPRVPTLAPVNNVLPAPLQGLSVTFVLVQVSLP